jgi:hypothetical protein
MFMKSSKLPRWIVRPSRAAFVGVGFVLASWGQNALAEGWLAPVDPVRLLLLLDETQPESIQTDGWTMVESRAFHDPEGEWMLSVARRKYEKPLSSEKPEAELAKLNWELTDSALHPARIAAFAESGAASSPTLQRVAGFPAIFSAADGGKHRAILFLHGRFLLSISSTGMPEEDFKKMLASLSTAALGAVERRVIASIPSPFPRKVVDEIQETEDSRPTQVLSSTNRVQAETQFQSTVKEADMILPDLPDGLR